jgi:ribonuclease HII
MTVHFRVRADAQHLEVALASLIAKLIRELLMERFNAFFAAHDGALHPTAGYPEDARRWLRDTVALRQQLELPDHLLIRIR